MLKCDNNFIKITLRHGFSPTNLLHIFRTPLPKNTYEGLRLELLRGRTFLFLDFGQCPPNHGFEKPNFITKVFDCKYKLT